MIGFNPGCSWEALFSEAFSVASKSLDAVVCGGAVLDFCKVPLVLFYVSFQHVLMLNKISRCSARSSSVLENVYEARLLLKSTGCLLWRSAILLVRQSFPYTDCQSALDLHNFVTWYACGNWGSFSISFCFLE